MRKHTSKQLVAAAAVAGAVAVSGIAYAYYASGVSGDGTGTATPAANAALDVDLTSGSAISGLVPGGAPVNTTVTLTNPNAYAVNIPAGKSISVSSVAGPAGCADNTVALLSGTAPIPAQVIAANGTTTVSVPVSMADSTTVNQNACAGSALTATYLVG